MDHEKVLNSLIVKDFRTFYEKIVLLKAKALTGELLAQKEREDTPTTLCREMQEELLTFLDTQHKYIERHGGGFAVQYYREAQYIMVALADEVFLTLDWVGREEWKDRLLESQLFSTQVAGERFFENLDEFLKVRDPSNSDIGVLYMIALGLGFQGRYRGVQDASPLKTYRDKLYSRVMHGSPYALEEKKKLFPEAYAHTIDTRDGVKVPSAKNWAMILGGVCGGYLILSWAIWAAEVSDVHTLVDQVMHWVKAR